MKRLITVIFTAAALVTAANAREIPRTLFVLNGLGRTLSKMNLETLDIENDIVTVGTFPNAVYARNGEVYVVNSTPPGILVYDVDTGQVTQEIALAEGSNPWQMAFVGANTAYVTNLLANSITIVDFSLGDTVGTIAVGDGPEGILVVNNTVYVASTGGWPDYQPSLVSVIDIRTNKVTKILEVPANPQDLALAPDGNIHVVCTGNYGDISGAVAVINPFADSDFTALVVDTLVLGGSPGDIVVTTEGVAFVSDFGDNDNGFLYSYNAFSGEISHDASNPIRVGKGAMNLLYDDSRAELYVNNFSDDNVQKLNSEDGAVLETYPFGDGAQAMAILEALAEFDPWADAVVGFSPGENAGFGQNFFPNNVLGPPDQDPSLSEFNASSKPQELLSLGHGGEIVLEFSDNVIVDSDGADFTVFENAFLNAFDNNNPFVEAARVAVSTDGVNFIEFPWDTTTWVGFAGVTPTLDGRNSTDPLVSGGDSFDLADLGLAYARFVKLTDIGDLKQEGAFNGDFDLDAVVAIHSATDIPTSIAIGSPQAPFSFRLLPNFPNPFNPETRIAFSLPQPGHVQLSIFNLTGQLVRALVDSRYAAGNFSTKWNGLDDAGREVASGIYIYEMKIGTFSTARRLTLLR